MSKLRGFLIAESLVGLTVAILGVTIMALVLSGAQKTERTLELKTDRTYAWHVMLKNDLKEVEVHNRVYQLVEKSRVYDKQAGKEYKIEK